MKTKSFEKYAEKRLGKAKINEINARVEREAKILLAMQEFVANMIKEYMEEKNLGFNQLVEKLHWSPTKLAKIKRGESNLTFSSLAELFSVLEKSPQDIPWLRK